MSEESGRPPREEVSPGGGDPESTSPRRRSRTLLQPRTAHQSPDYLESTAQSLRVLLHAWKRLLGLAAFVKLPPLTDRLQPKASALRRLLPALWILIFILVGLGGVGLQWARCEEVYLHRLTPSAKQPGNDTLVEYVCVHSFVWTYLLPRLVQVMGYTSVFVCWFCLKHPDLITVVAEVYESVTEQQEYPTISGLYMRHCRADRCLLSVLFVAVAAMSVVGTLVGDGVVHPAGLASTDSRLYNVIVAANVFNFIVALVLDNVMFFCLVSFTLSVKYLMLILQKTQHHLTHLMPQAHISSQNYLRPEYERGYRLMNQSQACVSAVILLILLRVSQGITLIILDQTLEKPRTESLGLLPLILAYTFALYRHLYLCYQLKIAGTEHYARHLSTGPDFTVGGASETEETTDDRAPLAAEPGASEPPPPPPSPPPRPAVQPPAAPTHMITGRVFGLDVDRWMFPALTLVIACYTGGYYAIERYWPLF